MMKLVDYDKEFRNYFEEYYQINKDKYKKAEEVEDALPEIYDKWEHGKLQELLPLSGDELVGLIDGYISAGMNVPDIVCDCIVRRKDTEKALYRLYCGNMYDEDKQVMLINMLSEMDSALPMASFVSMIASAADDSEAVNAAAEALTMTEHDFLEEALEAYEDAPLSGKELLMNAIVSKYKDERVYPLLTALFAQTENKAFAAAMLGEYGDERSLPLLYEAERSNSINYIDYTEICNAIERLGGETARDRDFEGDACYDMIARGEGV